MYFSKNVFNCRAVLPRQSILEFRHFVSSSSQHLSSSHCPMCTMHGGWIMRRLAVPVRHFRNAAVTVRQNWQAAGPVRRMSVAAAATVGDQDLKSVNTERTAEQRSKRGGVPSVQRVPRKEQIKPPKGVYSVLVPVPKQVT